MLGRQKNASGFTLIELLIAITIIAVLLAIAVPNFLGVRQRARDAKRKAELSELKKAMQLYYSDYNQYPADGGDADDEFNGCGTDGMSACPLSTGCEFAAGGATCDTATIYMKRLPRIDAGLSDFGFLYAQVDSNNFCLVTTLENLADTDWSDSQDRCRAFCELHSGVPFTEGKYIACND